MKKISPLDPPMYINMFMCRHSFGHHFIHPKKRVIITVQSFLVPKQDSPPAWPQEAYSPCSHLVMTVQIFLPIFFDQIFSPNLLSKSSVKILKVWKKEKKNFRNLFWGLGVEGAGAATPVVLLLEPPKIIGKMLKKKFLDPPTPDLTPDWHRTWHWTGTPPPRTLETQNSRN